MNVRPYDADSITRAAIRRWGVVDAIVVQYTEPRPLPSVEGGGDWYGLAVKPQPDDDWQAAGRRRTRGELQAMVESRSTPVANECRGNSRSSRIELRRECGAAPSGSRKKAIA